MVLDFLVPPPFVMLAGAVILTLIPRAVRPAVFLVFPLLSLALVLKLPDTATLSVGFLDYTLHVIQVDALSRVFGIVFCIIALAGGIYSYHVQDTGHQSAALAYAGSALGVTFAGDFLTLIVFWELMAIASTYLVWARRTRESEKAGMRYIFVHLLGGSLLLAGILFHVGATSSLALVQMRDGGTVSSWLILAGVSLNAAIPPLHAWLPDAYPRATVAGAVFLSAFTTKSAVYVLARLYPGLEILVALGVMMALYGVVFAVLANDIREILAYHIVSQVGYMVAGVGIGTDMALSGTVAHAFSHILYKALLFMGAGVVLHTTGKSRLTELGGLLRWQPVTFWLYIVGAFSISGFPLFNGFISKSMIVAAAGEAHYPTAYLLLHLASVGTFLSIGLKLPYFTWSATDRGIIPSKPPLTMHAGMALVAFLCILFGTLPTLLYKLLPYPLNYEPYTLAHLTETTQMLLSTFIAFWIFRTKLAAEPTITLDTDWFYRIPARYVNLLIVDGIGAVFDKTERLVLSVVKDLARRSQHPFSFLQDLVERDASQARDPQSEPNVVRQTVGSLLMIVLISVLGLFVLSILWLTMMT